MNPEQPRPEEVPAVPANLVWYRTVLLCRKELRETLRDRRTIITLLAMPLLLYPLLGMVFRFLAVSQFKKEGPPEYILAVGTEVEALWLKASLDVGEQTLQGSRVPVESSGSQPLDSPVRTVRGLQQQSTADSQSGGNAETGGSPRSDPPEVAQTTTFVPANDPTAPAIRIVTPDDAAEFDLTAAVSSSDADLGVSVQLDRWSGRVELLQPAVVRLISNRDSAASREALRYVEDRLQAANLLSMYEAARTWDSSVTLPVRFAFQYVISDQKSRGFLGLLPLVLLLMTVTGGVYPAIDLTAGERERDTLETLIALPIPRVHLLLAKYVAVFSVTQLTGLVNILAMTATVYTLRMETQLFGDDGLTVRLGMSLFLILVVFGLFYSAVLLALTSSSRSFKEAQAYLIPLMLMSIAPGLVILLPGWHLQGLIAIVPLVNMLLLARDVFEGVADVLPASVAVVSTLIYAACALTVAARLFGTDAIAVGSRGTWSDLWRRPQPVRSGPPLTTAMVTLALMFPLYFFANGLLSRTGETNPQIRLLTAGGLTILLFGIFPLGIAIWRRLNLPAAWQFRTPPKMVWPAMLLLGLGTWPWIYELVLVTSQLGLAQLDPERLQQVSEILERWKAIPLWMMLLSLGVLPGVFEELFFRGFLLSALRSSFRPWSAILLCGTIFGVFHVIAAEGAAVERLLPSALLGCLLSWTAVRTGSVWPGMLLHVLHNSSLLVIAQFRDELAGLSIGATQQQHLPSAWLAVSASAVAAGIIWVTLTTDRHSPSVDSA